MDQNPHFYYNHVVVRKTLQFLVPVSIFSFLITYFSGFPVVLDQDQFSSWVNFPLLNQGFDRKYMFLICNGILAFLSKNLDLGSSGFIMNDIAEDGLKQIPEMQMMMIKESEILNHENSTSMDYVEDIEEEEEEEEEEVVVEEEEEEWDSDSSHDEAGEIMETDQTLILESDEDWHINEVYDDDDDEVIIEDVESTSLNDVRISTEELNKKFEEFIRKMKEEIRIEARQRLIAAA